MSIEEEELVLEQRLRGRRPRARKKAAVFDWSQADAHAKYAEKLQSQQTRRQQKVSNPRLGLHSQGTYWWYAGFTKEGRTYVDGAFLTKAEAEAAAAKDPDIDTYETVELDTKSRERARAIVKAKGILEGLAGEHHGSDTMLKRISWGPAARADRGKFHFGR